MRSNRIWLPSYCNPDALLPKVQETRTLFSRRPYAFPDFIGRAMAFLQSDEVRSMGFEFDPDRTVPCKWKCSDECLFGVDLAIYAQTGHYPFDKGKIGGMFNEQSLGAAVHHGPINIDIGGSHVGYLAGADGGSFGAIWRPQQGVPSTDCGYLTGLLQPFLREYDDAARNVLVHRPVGEDVIVSVPNEFVQPNWSARSVKLLVDTDTLTEGEVDYVEHLGHTHTPIGRTLFRVSQRFLDQLSEDERQRLTATEPTPIGHALTHEFFSIFDVEADLDPHGLPRERLLLYMKYILSAKHAPPALKAAIINANIEHNHLTDTVRAPAYRAYAFASFSGVFLDLFDEEQGRYATLFQPLAIAIKAANREREYELLPDEIHHRFDALRPAPPVIPMGDVLRMTDFDRWVQQFTFSPSSGRASREP